MSSHPLSPRDRVDAWCALRGASPLGALEGGETSVVVAATAADGSPIVVKASDDTVAALCAEAAWVGAHPSAPTVVELDEDLEVLVLERVDGVSLKSLSVPIDVPREVAWIRTAAGIDVGAGAGLEDVRDLVGRAAAEVVGRGDLDAALVERIVVWQRWAAGLEGSGWRAVAFDMINKNTLVDASGRWWAIDPLCVLGPPAFAACGWIMSRANRGSIDGCGVVGTQQLFVDALDGVPGEVEEWMPAISLWTLWWCQPGIGSYDHVVAALRWWLDRWAARHP